ncbi:M23 family metallopeptidase [Wielerella bovis]|uniref:M23 family metallopeptidase n=1 Tax=Wielerella bovis TaxID=2917790 RepID=UPI002018E9DA|nr:M23 family metallopeptidase [Wielerella bovis]ULJ68664.1 M23 family metallopeptidase [Wielerella bovis]
MLTTIPAALILSGAVWANTHGTAQQTEYKTKLVVQELPLPKITSSNTPASYWYDEEVQTGDNLSVILGRLGVSEHSIQTFLKESPIDTKMLQLRAGQIISARVDSAKEVTDIQFFNDNEDGERTLIAIEKVNGKWQLHAGAVDTETMPSLRSVVVITSASGALARAGVPVEIRTALKEVFADKLDLDALKSGDSVRVLYESLYFRGQEVATGNVLAAEITTGGKTYYGYYFENGEQDNGGNYYDENGNALKKGFDGLPIESFTRISSPYGIRIHPIFRTVRMHTGIDYAAPTGTKVLSPSDGVVSFRGWKGGYGNTVMVRHSDGMETLYAHLSSFIQNVDMGTPVGAGTVIGLVGSTGNSTGPHLHYEVRINGQHVNPAAVALPTPKLSIPDMAALKKYRAKTDDIMQAVRGLPVMVAQRD